MRRSRFCMTRLSWAKKRFIHKMRRLIIMGLVIAFWQVAHAAEIGPSFDCATAKSDAEKLICANSSLAEQDRELNRNYKNALEKLAIDKQSKLRENQHTWLKQRDIYCARDQRSCKFWYQLRIADLQKVNPELNLCSYETDNGQFTKGIDFNGDQNQKKEIQFIDFTGRIRKAVIRKYSIDPSDIGVLDLLLYDEKGRIFRMVIDSQLSAIGFSAKAVRVNPGYDSIYIDHNSHLSSNPVIRNMAIVDPTNCKQFNASFEPTGFNFFDTSYIWAMNHENELMYLEKQAKSEGVPTEGMVQSESSDPKWARLTWKLNNPKSKDDRKRNLKLQWYSWDDKQCAAGRSNSEYYTYKNIMLRGPKGDHWDQEVVACDSEKRQWSPLFVSDNRFEWVSSFKVSGPNVTLQTDGKIMDEDKRTININLDDWVWAQTFNPKT